MSNEHEMDKATQAKYLANPETIQLAIDAAERRLEQAHFKAKHAFYAAKVATLTKLQKAAKAAGLLGE